MILGVIILLFIVAFFVLGGVIVAKEYFVDIEDVVIDRASPFEKKPFVFDVVSELNLYRVLLGLFGDKYYVFPQLVYSRLIQLKRGEHIRNRTYFDKKIADFVLCDKERAIAQLVIELDGSSHDYQKKIERDAKVDRMMRQIGLPILHLKPGNLDSGYIKGEVERLLAPKV